MIKNIVKKVFGIPRITYPYVDDTVRINNMNSHMGGEIGAGVVIIVGDNTQFNSILQEKYELERYKVYTILEKDFLEKGITDILSNQKVSIFVNVVENLKTKSENINNDIVHSFYCKCQLEGDYYINNQRTGHIVNLLINSEDNQVVSSCVKGLTEGLGVAFGNHKIIVNGILSDINVGEENIGNWTLFLSSKYGDLLCGNVLNLHTPLNRKERLQSV